MEHTGHVCCNKPYVLYLMRSQIIILSLLVYRDGYFCARSRSYTSVESPNSDLSAKP